MRLCSKLLALVLIALVTLAASPRQSQGAFSNLAVSYEFGNRAVFTVDWSGSITPDRVVLFFRPEGRDTRIVELAQDRDGRYEQSVLLDQNDIRAFSRVEYWFQADFHAGGKVISDTASFEYSDNRADWQTLQDGNLVVLWQDGDLDFGQFALNTATAGLDRVRLLIPFEPQVPVRLYIYPNPTVWQTALQSNQENWFSGHVTPDLGVALLSVQRGPDERFEIERQIPHELMHIAQYQAVGKSYDQLPWWFSEGYASLAELYPNPEYRHAVEKAAREGNLLSLSSLCDSFPPDSQGAFLAYAQSASFVEYLQRNYGTSRLVELSSAYANGMGCSEGLQSVMGKPISALDVDWRRQEFGVGELGWAVNQLAPYIVVLGLLIIPLPLAWLAHRRPTPALEE